MIDLHLHTTASDGRCTPDELVVRAAEQGIRIIAVTDHDTMAGVAAAVRAGTSVGVTVIPGIEITSVWRGKDVHVLAYFLAALTPELEHLLAVQRHNRLERAREIAARLAALGAPIDVDALIGSGEALHGKSLARPQIAQALIAAGHVASVAEAFDRYLADHQPAFVPHAGASPMEVVELVAAAGGISSLAHPGYTKMDDVIQPMVDAGLHAIEAHHSAHDRDALDHYRSTARALGLLVSGGSDYHGPGTRRAEWFGVTALPAVDFLRLCEAAGQPDQALVHQLIEPRG